MKTQTKWTIGEWLFLLATIAICCYMANAMNKLIDKELQEAKAYAITECVIIGGYSEDFCNNAIKH